MRVDELKSGRVYFSLMYADYDLSLPIVSTYQYEGPSGDEDYFNFRGLNEEKATLQMTERDIEDLVGLRDLANALQEWSETHPDRAS